MMAVTARIGPWGISRVSAWKRDSAISVIDREDGWVVLVVRRQDSLAGGDLQAEAMLDQVAGLAGTIG